MNVLIDRSEIAGTIPAPPSKSYTHRAIAIASLSVESEIRITGFSCEVFHARWCLIT